ncbi:MAG: MurR/RpiR family transcriptional regulator [Atribacterota bacterium]
MKEQGGELFKKVKENSNKLNPMQRKLIKFILDNYMEVGFMSAAKLARKVHTSQSTVLRLSNTLGYEGYGFMQSDIQAMIKRKISYAAFVDKTKTSDVNSNLKGIEQFESLYSRVINLDIENIKNTKRNINVTTLVNVVDDILKAKNIYVLGLRSSASLAIFFGISLNMIMDNNVKILNNINCSLFDQSLAVTKKDILICFAFPRYTKETVKLIKFAKKKEIKTVVFTDDILTPFSEDCDYLIPININSTGYIGSYVAPLSLINFILSLTTYKKGRKALARLKEVEKYIKEYGVFYSDK